MRYHNPVIRGFYPDPSVCRVGKTFYLVTSSFEYLPAVALFKSYDLVNWESMGHCLTKESQIDLGGVNNSGGIFAPTIRYYNEMLFMITTNRKHGNFFVWSNNLGKSWSDPIFLDIEGIDPSLYMEDNQIYVQYAAVGSEKCIKQTSIDIKSGALLTKPVVISYGSGGRDVEAPHIYKKEGYYYLIMAEGGTREGHMVTGSRSRSIWGPYEDCPNNPILTNRNASKERLQSVGHMDIVEDQYGDWWGVALATRPVKHKTILGRETILLPMIWQDGWPVVGEGYAHEVVDNSRRLHAGRIQQKTKTAPFIMDGALSSDFNAIREFWGNELQIVDSCSIGLTPLPETLNSLGKIAFVGRRQQSYQFTVNVRLDFSAKNREEAGLTLYADRYHHYDFYLSSEKEQILTVKCTLHEIESHHQIKIRQKDAVSLKIVGDETHYEFYYSIDGLTYRYITRVSHRYLANEISDSPFTGVYIAMYATSNGSESRNQAIFRDFRYSDIASVVKESRKE